mmetsp:Transcript_41773/g.87218  ORF Transcript_41773/g.87218 Transcript_41773/m.87218 type:complete len:186 (-) Transcript_41773:179-736(-)
MGNLSLKYIYPSFNQMLGSMSPLITVLLAVVMQQKHFPLKTWLSMPVICVGLAVCSAKELNFNALGAFYASGATVLRAVKSLIQGRLLSTSHQMDSVTLLYYMAPWAAMWLTLIMLFMEVGARWRRRRNWRRPSAFPPDAFRLERMPSEHCKLSGNLLHQPCHSPSSWQCQELPLHCRLSGDFQE